MVKVLVIPHEDIILGSSVSSLLLLTWFNLSEILPPSFNLKEWNLIRPLYFDDDSDIEVLNRGDKYIFIAVPSIVRIENNSDESTIHLENGEKLSSPFTIDYWEEKLRMHNFFLIHPNHLINLIHMQSYVQCNAFVKLSNSDAIPVEDKDQKLVKYLNKKTII